MNGESVWSDDGRVSAPGVNVTEDEDSVLQNNRGGMIDSSFTRAFVTLADRQGEGRRADIEVQHRPASFGVVGMEVRECEVQKDLASWDTAGIGRVDGDKSTIRTPETVSHDVAHYINVIGVEHRRELSDGRWGFSEHVGLTVIMGTRIGTRIL